MYMFEDGFGRECELDAEELEMFTGNGRDARKFAEMFGITAEEALADN